MGSFDLIIDIVFYVYDLNLYVGILNINGILVVVGYLGFLDFLLVMVFMIMGCKFVVGFLIGGIVEM